MVEPEHPELSLRRQCELLGLNRATWYYQPAEIAQEDLWLMQEIDRVYTAWPFYGSRKITEYLSLRHQTPFNRKRIQRLMQIMGNQGLAPGPNTSQPHPEQKVYPYLLRNLAIDRVNHVWSTDLTYIPMLRGYMYLVAVIDWHSRYVLSWALSNTQDTTFCLEALEQALSLGKPDIFNTDQGSQFTSHVFTQKLLENEIRISMDGKG